MRKLFYPETVYPVLHEPMANSLLTLLSTDNGPNKVAECLGGGLFKYIYNFCSIQFSLIFEYLIRVAF